MREHMHARGGPHAPRQRRNHNNRSPALARSRPPKRQNRSTGLGPSDAADWLHLDRITFYNNKSRHQRVFTMACTTEALIYWCV